MSAKYGYIYQSNWGQSGPLNHDAYIFNRKTNTMLLDLKLQNPAKANGWSKNDGSILLGAICTARTTAASATAAGTAPALEPVSETVEEYVGSVKAVHDNEVIAEIRPIDDEDGWDVILPRDSFKGDVHEEQEFKCTITRKGSHVNIEVKVLDSNRLRELKDFDINEAEWLQWASQIDV